MSRYIDADKMLEICTNYIASVFPKEYKFAKQDAELLTTMAWFEDKAIDIVRCKECKWKRLYDEGDTKYYYCALEDRPNRQWSIDETDYCSWGERDE